MKKIRAMKTPREAMMSLAAVAIAMSAMVACGPPMNAQSPKGGAGDGSDAGAAPEGQASSAAPPPLTEAECRVRASSVRTEPSGAQGDVQQQYDAFFLAQQETFRCCFDALYAPKNPRTDGQVALFVKVEASGKLASSEIVASETTARGPEMNACILEVARAIAYPSPVNKATVGYKRTFQFKARR
jgi:hypothetical protein